MAQCHLKIGREYKKKAEKLITPRLLDRFSTGDPYPHAHHLHPEGCWRFIAKCVDKSFLTLPSQRLLPKKLHSKDTN